MAWIKDDWRTSWEKVSHDREADVTDERATEAVEAGEGESAGPAENKEPDKDESGKDDKEHHEDNMNGLHCWKATAENAAEVGAGLSTVLCGWNRYG